MSVFGAASSRAELEQFEKLGVKRLIVGLPTESEDAILKLLDTHAQLIGA